MINIALLSDRFTSGKEKQEILQSIRETGKKEEVEIEEVNVLSASRRIREYVSKHGGIENATEKNGGIRNRPPYAGHYNKKKARNARAILGIKLTSHTVAEDN